MKTFFGQRLGAGMRLRTWWCEKVRRGHDWFPRNTPSEFLPTKDICLRCPAERTFLPLALCLGGDHPLADHYDAEGHLRPHPSCGGPA